MLYLIKEVIEMNNFKKSIILIIGIIGIFLTLNIIKKDISLENTHSLRRSKFSQPWRFSFPILQDGEYRTPDGRFEIKVKNGVITLEHKAWGVREGVGKRGRKVWFDYYKISLQAESSKFKVEETISPKASMSGYLPSPEETYSLEAIGQHLRGFVYTNDKEYGTERPTLYIIVSDEFGERYFLDWDPFSLGEKIERLLVPWDSPQTLSSEDIKRIGYFIRVITESKAKSLGI